MPAHATSEGVRLVASGPGLVHFAIEVPAPVLRPLAAEAPADASGESAVALSLEGYEDQAAPGGFSLPVRVVTVAVPPTGAVRLRADAIETRVLDAVRLAPLARFPSGAKAAALEAAMRPAEDASAPRVARLLGVSWMRNQRVARIAITPADYDGPGRRLRVSGRIDVRLEVNPGPAGADAAEESDPFEGVYRDVLVNYEQGKSWRRARATGRSPSPGVAERVGALAGASGVFAGRSWLKIAISATGFYKVDFGQLRSFAPFSSDTTVPLDSLRLFTWPGNPVLPEDDYCDACDYREVSLGIVDNGDGRFNRNSDAFYFFALGASDWADLYDPTQPDTVFVNNPYETRSFVYLTVSTAENPVPGPFRRIANAVGTPAPNGDEITPTTFQARVHRELDREYLPHVPAFGSTMVWEKWFWQSLSLNGTFAASVDAPGADITQAARLRTRLWGLVQTGLCHAADIQLNQGTTQRFAWRDRAYFRGGGSYPILLSGYTADASFTGLSRTSNTLRVSVPTDPSCNPAEERIGVAWFDLFYRRAFEPAGDELQFDSPAVSGDYLFRIAPFTSSNPPRVFDVTDAYAPIEVLGAAYEVDGAAHRLSLQAAQTGLRRYRVIQEASIVKVATASISEAPATSLVDLRNPARRADYLVIHYDDFKTAADTLANWRRNFNGFETTTVPVSALYDQFSGGRTDPAAIRNFMRGVFLNWEKKPAFVTLLGDASFDFKNYLGLAGPGQPGTLLPSYENGFDDSPIIYRQFDTDDWLLNVDTAAVVVPDFFGGRIPAADPTAALSIVRHKVLLYERSAPFGEYRNRLMLIADDDRQALDADPLRWTHLVQTSELDTSATPRHIDRAYVYLHTYPSGAGATKPGANAEIKENINEGGVAMFNYIGHGSPFQLSDERVFLNTDVGTLTNATRLPLFVAASCDVGKFNDPRVLSLGELLLTQAGGGAIGVISSTEEAFSGQNARLNRDLYRFIFSRDSAGHYHVPLSEALLRGKSGSTNSQKYQLMGDAGTRLNLPRLWTELTVWDSSGTQPLAGLPQGTTVLFRGRVLDGPGGPPLALDGVASILIEDSAPREVPPNCTPISFCSFYYRPGPVYRGELAISGGSFEGRFVVPLDARLGSRGRLRAYVSGRTLTAGTTDAVGDFGLQLVSGSAPTGDREGPRITLTFAGGATSVRPDAVLRVFLFDPSGILITGNTPQNGIVVTVDEDPTQRFDITPSFRYAAGSYQSGAASYPLSGLAPGSHRIRVSAADNLAAGFAAGAHRSSATIDFEVEELPPLDITRAYLFPNPVESGGGRSGGQFVIDAPGDSVNVLLRIYTVSGRLVRTLRSPAGLGQVQIAWDGLDAEGKELANGLYVFKVHVYIRQPDGGSSARQRAAAEGKFVVVNR